MTSEGADTSSGETGDLLLSLEGVGVRADSGRWILRDVSLRLRRGEIVTIIGPNGGGKTTLVRTALGIVAPTTGRVWRKPGLCVAYTPQKVTPDSILPITVARFLHLSLHPAPSGEAVRTALARTGTATLADQQLAALSSGELQRVLIARAILRQPDLLVLDEPVQGVDFAGEAALYDLIRALRQETGCGVLMVSHDLHFVMAGTDRVICVNGHICCAGTPQAVSQSDAYAALFGHAAGVHRAAYAHLHDHEHDLCDEPGRR